MGCNCSKDSQTCQPRSKDIPIELDVREECTFKDERETTDNAEIIRGDIRSIITRALEESLMGYKVHGQAIPPGGALRVLEVKRMDNKITVTPDSTGTSLTQGLLNTKYDLYAAVDSTTHSVVFLYQWKTLKGQIFVACPYFQEATDGSIVPCAKVDITQALNGSDPVKAVMAELKKILKDGFEWNMHGADNDFTISPKIYWRDIDKSSDIKLTYNGSIKLVMKLELV